MCVLRFFKNLVTPKNWPLLLYLILNMALVYIAIIGCFFDGEFDFNNMNFVYTTIAFFGGYLLILIILATPVGEALFRLTVIAKKMERNEDTDQIYKAFDEVYAKTLEKNPSFSKKVQLYYVVDDDANAFALGTRTLIVNTGLLNLPEDPLKGILAHEFGHLVHSDSLSKLSLIISNWLVYLLFTIAGEIAYLFFMLFDAIIGAICKLKNNPFILGRTARFIVTLVYRIWLGIGTLLTLATSRKEEYAADKYANELGYGTCLAEGLARIDNGFSLKNSIIEMIYSTHPSTSKRIEKLGFDPVEVQTITNKFMEIEQQCNENCESDDEVE